VGPNHAKSGDKNLNTSLVLGENKDDTAPEIFRHNFNELCAGYKHCTRVFTPMDPKWVME